MTDAASPSLPFSTRTRVVLALARGIAAARGDSYLTPVHVALGLIREAENAAVAALDHAGVAVDKVRGELEVALGNPGIPRVDEVVIPLTDGERHLVDEARNQSRLRGDEYLGPHHLLLAVLCDRDSVATRVFRRHGFHHETALTHLNAVFRKPDGASDSPAGAV